MHHELGRALYGLGDIEAARAHLETAARLSDSVQPWLGLATIAPAVPSLSAARVRAIRVEAAERLATWTAPDPHRTFTPSVESKGDAIHVGYLSAHFHLANYMKPVWGLINHHDRDRVRVHLLVDHPSRVDSSGYVANSADRVTHTERLDCARLAQLIEQSGIDILVDLNGYGVPGRLPLLLRRNAPVTVAWFNMYGTTGLPGIDAVVGDAVVVPPCDEGDFAEEVLRLPGSYLTFVVNHPAPPVVEPPGLSRGVMTFGCMAPLYKITPHVLDAWAAILSRAPRARLLLANRALGSSANRAHVARELSDRGIGPERVVLRGPAPHHRFLRCYDEVDVALDTFPYSGGTTTMEALWQGVPVLTFRGDRWASRISESLLRHAGMEEWVTDDQPGYVARAATLAADPRAFRMLAALRSRMRDSLARSRVCHVAALARGMEALYDDLMARR